MDHQVVAGIRLDGHGGPEDAQPGVGEVANLGVHRVEAIEQVRDGRGLELGYRVHGRGVGPLDAEPHSEPRPWVHLSRLGLAH